MSLEAGQNGRLYIVFEKSSEAEKLLEMTLE